MSVLSVVEVFDSRAGSKLLEKFSRKYTRVFKVETSVSTDSAAVVLASCPVALGEGFPTDTGSFCRSINARQAGKYTLWEITVEYDSVSPDGKDPSEQHPNPTLRPPNWRVDFERYKEAVKVDLDSKPVVNSANDAFLPPYEINRTQVKYTYETNLPSFDVNQAFKYIGTINKDPWYKFGINHQKHSVMFDNVTAHEEFENGIKYVKAVYTLMVRLKWIEEENKYVGAWHPVLILDEGYYEKGSGGSQEAKKKPIRDKSGAIKTTPTLLDGDGKVKAPGEDGTITPVYREFKFYKEVDFTQIIPEDIV